jgi:hypothetical protein
MSLFLFSFYIFFLFHTRNLFAEESSVLTVILKAATVAERGKGKRKEKREKREKKRKKRK